MGEGARRGLEVVSTLRVAERRCLEFLGKGASFMVGLTAVFGGALDP